MYYDIVLKRKFLENGLTKEEVVELCEKLIEDEFLPLQLDAKYSDSSALGFITPNAARLLEYDYVDAGLLDYISLLLDIDESENNEYEFRGIKIWFCR